MQGRSGSIKLVVASLLLGASLDCSSPYSTATSESGHVLAGTVDGLEGKPVTLVLNGTNPVEVGEDGSFSFPTPLAEGTGYVVTVAVGAHQESSNATLINGDETNASAANAGAVYATDAAAQRGPRRPMSRLRTPHLKRGSDGPSLSRATRWSWERTTSGGPPSS